jgi:hypothetical protein
MTTFLLPRERSPRSRAFLSFVLADSSVSNCHAEGAEGGKKLFGLTWKEPGEELYVMSGSSGGFRGEVKLKFQNSSTGNRKACETL